VRPYSSDIISELGFEAIRSRGPGGQNVNKVSSAAQMRWNFEGSQHLSIEHKNLIRQKLSFCINKEGELYLRSDEYRDLAQNKKRCLEKLDQLLDRAFHKPKPRTATKPTRASKHRKKESKVHRSKTKQSRQKLKG
jgi:ribosome-associated protein